MTSLPNNYTRRLEANLTSSNELGVASCGGKSTGSGLRIRLFCMQAVCLWTSHLTLLVL